MATIRSGSRSVATVYDLISEGPINLVNGLNSIYLDRTPLTNKVPTEEAPQVYDKFPATLDVSRTSINYAPFFKLLNEDGTVENLTLPSLQDGNSTNNTILVHGGSGQDTITTITQVSGENQSTITTTGNFFREKLTLIANLTQGTGYTDGTYTITTANYTDNSVAGSGAEFSIVIENGVTSIQNITITTAGSNYFHGETFTVPVSAVGGTGTASITFDVSSRFLTPQGVGLLKQKIRIPAYGQEGANYVGQVVAMSSASQVTVSPALGSTDTSTPPTIYWDYFTTSVSTERYTIGYYVNWKITLPEVVPNTNLSDTNIWFSYDRKSNGTLTNLTPGSANFPSARAAFMPGTLTQPPQGGIGTIASATNATAIEQPIKQYVDYFNNIRLSALPGKYSHELPEGQTADTAETLISASQAGASAPGEVDELQVTFNFPSGLYTQGESDNGNDNAAVFQIYFDYKVGDGDFKSNLVFGPSDDYLSTVDFFAANNTSTLKKGQVGNIPGEFRSQSEVSTDFSVRWSIEEFKPFTDWKIRIRKVTQDTMTYRDGVLQVIAESQVKTVTTIINDKLSYPFSAYGAVSFSSTDLKGNFPERAYHCKGIRVSVPTNYTTRDEASSGIANYNRNITTGVEESTYQVWDGNFRIAYTDNPVWNLREILLNKRWGLGHWLEEENINDYSLYSLARYCDELVPNGKGGLEPRFTCGVYLTQPTEAYKVIKDFCSTMFALPYWVDGQFILEGDRRGSPVYTFTKGNVIDGAFSYEGTGNKTRPNQIVVRFNDKENFYDEDIELVDDVEDMIQKNRIFTQEVVAFGATSRSQARRFGKWKLLTSKMQKEMVSFRTGENAGFIKPGSIINVQDADRSAVKNSGRIASGSTTTVIELDRPVTLAAGETHEIFIQLEGSATYLAQESATISGTAYSFGDIIAGVTTQEAAEILKDSVTDEAVTVQFVPDVHLVKKTIDTSGLTLPATVTSVTITEALSTAAEQEFIWGITSTRDGATVAGSTKQYRVLGIVEESPGVYAISAAEHYNSKFDLLDETLLSESPDQVPRYADVPPPVNVTLNLRQSAITDSDSKPTKKLVLNWERSKTLSQELYENLAFYRIFYTPPGKDKQTEIIDVSPDTTNYSISDITAGQHIFRIQGISGFGPVSAPVTTAMTIGELGTSAFQYIAGLPAGGTMFPVFRLDGSNIRIPTDSSGHAQYEVLAASGQKIYVSATEPVDPVEGAIWYDSLNNVQEIGNTTTASWEEGTLDADTISVINQTISSSKTTPSTTSVTLLNEQRFNSDGTVDTIKSLDGTPTETLSDIYDWCDPNNPSPNNYQIKAQQVSAPTDGATFTGFASSVNIGNWQNLTANQTAGMTVSGTSKNSTGKIKISIKDSTVTPESIIDFGEVTFNNTITELNDTTALPASDSLYDWSSDTTSSLTTKLRFTNTGLVRHIQFAGGVVNKGDWISPTSSAPGSYYVRFTAPSVTTNTFTGSTLSVDGSTGNINTWLPLTTTRNLQLVTGGSGAYAGTWRVEISDDYATNPSSPNIWDSVDYSVSFERVDFGGGGGIDP